MQSLVGAPTGDADGPVRRAGTAHGAQSEHEVHQDTRVVSHWGLVGNTTQTNAGMGSGNPIVMQAALSSLDDELGGHRVQKLEGFRVLGDKTVEVAQHNDETVGQSLTTLGNIAQDLGIADAAVALWHMYTHDDHRLTTERKADNVAMSRV